jgi:stalled ribosome rescue protein Dom34
MSLFHAVAWVDHHAAQVFQFDASQVLAQQVREHARYTRQHGSGVRSEHEFFGEVCNALKGITQVLVTGSRMAQADFRHYVEKHRPEVAGQIVGWETAERMSTNELVALARRYFSMHEGMAAPMKAG